MFFQKDTRSGAFLCILGALGGGVDKCEQVRLRGRCSWGCHVGGPCVHAGGRVCTCVALSGEGAWVWGPQVCVVK